MPDTITPRHSTLSSTLAKDPRPAVPVVLADFRELQLSAPCPQDELKAIQAHFMTIAQSAKAGIESASEREALAAKIRERMDRYGASSEHIAWRQVNALNSRFVSHPSSGSAETLAYGTLRTPTGELLDERMTLFEETAGAVFNEIYEEERDAPDGIVHVSCSGYVSPSPAQVFLSRKGWLRTEVTHSYHMGCYGAFPAVRTAVGLIGSSYASLPSPRSRVDLVHTEFLSLHFDLLGETADAFVTSTLFADGFIKYSAYPRAAFERTGRRGLQVLSMEERILPDSLPEMTLRPGPLQFDMSLSKKVPFLIRDSIADFVASLCAQAGLDFEAEKSKMTFAIHPGGPAILNQIRSRIGIEESQLALSRAVLREHGNMASATAPHIWQLIVESGEIPVGTKVVSMAFGPGLTVIGALFEKV
ncbi:MAG TPA: 3-oxoacyl-[acyl-carrier-protein] synthase III C-terminal domain-containing protein [Verrucomicrobiae bacterium]|nr:3-oxoacyl-[acyl-carrier-protein] synthase III C-terminal domain-containing protein [Verrucomicrobiae bacterium]